MTTTQQYTNQQGDQAVSIYRGSQVQVAGVKGTYSTNLGGVGLGYEMPNGDVVHSGGNGFYYLVDDLASFWSDGGKAYMAAMRGDRSLLTNPV